MPRNAAGVYSLPDPPRVPNTTIDSPDENVTRDDIGAELTNSLDRNGRGGMLAPFRIADGTMAAPGLAFLNEPGSGMYRIGGSDWALAVQGAKVMEFTANTVTIPVGVGVNIASSLTVGGLQVNSNLIVSGGIINTGTTVSMFLGTNNAPGLEITHVTAPVNWLRIVPSLAGSAVVIVPAGASADVPLAIAGKGNAGVDLYANGAGPLVLRTLPGPGPNFITLTSGTNPIIAASAGNMFHTSFSNFTAGLTVPSGNRIYIDGAGDTFIAENAANVMSLFTGGVESLKVTNALAQFSGGLSIAAAAALYLDGGFDTYIQESSANTVAHFAGGTGRFFVSSVNVLANTTLSVASGFEFNLLGSAGSNFARLTYTPAGSTTLTIDNGFNDLAAEIRLRTCTTAAPVNCLVLSGNLCTFNPRVVITKGDTSEAAPHLQLIDTASGFAGAHWMDATAYYINQNAGGRQVRVSSGANSAIGVALVAGATAWANYSDERMKDIIEPITNAAAKVSSMRHVIGTLKSDDNKTRRAMLIAQDVLKVLPEAVSVDRDEYLLLEYSSLIPLHGAAIAEHEARIRALEGKLQ